MAGPAAVGAFAIFAAPLVGIGSWKLVDWMKRLKTRDPSSHRAIRRVQESLNAKLLGDARFADIDPTQLAEADSQLSKLAAHFWPTPNIIVELAADREGFPDAISRHVLDEINGSAFATGLFEDAGVAKYARHVIGLALEVALEDPDYFAQLEPQAMMEQLKLTGQIQRDVTTFVEELRTANDFVGETLNRIESKIDLTNVGIEQLKEGISKLTARMLPTEGATQEQVEQATQTATEMLLSGRRASMDAATDLMADPPNPVAATNRLKQGIAEQTGARIEATRNEVAMWDEIATINYFSNGSEALEALEAIVKLNPSKTDAWNRLGHLNSRFGNLDAAIVNYNQVLTIGETRDDDELRAIAYGNMGIVAQIRGDLDGAMGYYEQSLALNAALGRKEGMANDYGNMGNVAQVRGDLDGAMGYYEQSLAIETALGRKEGMANQYGNMGIVAQVRGDLDGAMGYYEQSLAIETALGRKEGMANQYGNMGIVAQIRGDLDGAMGYYEQSLALNAALGRKEGMANDYGNMGNVAKTRGDLDGAMGYYEQSLAIETALGRKEGMANDYGNMGNVAQVRGDLDGAMGYYEQSLALNAALGRKEGMANQYGNMGIVAQTQGDLDGARENWERAFALFTEVGAAPKIELIRSWIDSLPD